MGNVQASTVKNMIDITNSTINSTVNSSSTSNEAKSVNRQTFDVLFGPNSDIKGCTLTALSNITSNQTLKTSSAYQTETAIKNQLSNVIDQVAETNQKAVAEFLSLSGNAQLSTQDLATSIKNDIQNKITNENVTSCTAYVDNLQDGKFTFLGKFTCPEGGTGITLTQNIVNDQLSECISQVFFSAIADNSIVNDVVQKAKTSQDARTIGPIGALLGGLGGLVGIVIIIVIGYFIYKQFSGKTPAVASKVPAVPKALPAVPKPLPALPKSSVPTVTKKQG